MASIPKKVCFLAFFSFGLCLLYVGVVTAQENYPVPPGNPDKWGIPGRSETIQSGQPSPEEATNLLAAPSRPGNEEGNRVNTPSGEAQEEYTGTRQFGGIAGTGITPFGTQNRR